jgi:HK97 family phage major capsid protein
MTVTTLDPLNPNGSERMEPAGGLDVYLGQLLKRHTKLVRDRDELKAKAEAVLMEARGAGRDVLEAEEDKDLRGYMTNMAKIGDELSGLEERIEQTRAEVERSGTISKGLARIRAAGDLITRVKEQSTYPQPSRSNPAHVSYLQDLIKYSMNLDTTGQARDRLFRHAQDVMTDDAYKEFRDLSRVDGSGGYAVPPAWLMSQYIELARPGRAIANLVQRQPLPGGTDSINIPKLLSGSQTAVQQHDNDPVTDVDITDTFINAPVRTIAGQQGLAIQLIDQSPIAFDDVVFRDLVADHASRTDAQVISGTGVSGQILGILQTPNIGSVAATTVDIKGFYSAIANAIQTVHTTRFQPPEVIVMHPRRWGWFTSLLDGNQRPLVLPIAGGPFNVAGLLEAVDSQQRVGQIQGLPVVTDPNLPTTGGAGTEDPVLVMRASDIVLWEGGIRSRVLPETKAANLTVLLQIYNYLAFSAARYPASIVQVTGLTAPVW